MSDTNKTCCPDCGADQTAQMAELAALQKRTDEATAAVEAHKAELRVLLEQRMEAGEDISPALEALEREGFDISELLIG